MKQTEFDLGMDQTRALTISFVPAVQERLVHLMAIAILAVHHAGKEARDDAGRLES